MPPGKGGHADGQGLRAAGTMFRAGAVRLFVFLRKSLPINPSQLIVWQLKRITPSRLRPANERLLISESRFF